MRDYLPRSKSSSRERRCPPADIESAAYYVIAEGLTNVTKHAQANTVVITMAWENDELSVVVRDDGVGGAAIGGGSGLVGLNDRVAAVGGTLLVADAQDG